MSAAEPTPSPLPKRPSSPKSAQDKTQRPLGKETQESGASRPHPIHGYPMPKLRFQIHDLSHPASSIFLNNCDASKALSSAVDTVLSTLYIPTKSNDHIPGTRSVTVILDPMGGVAYTTGMQLDNDHKEIHFSMEYISHISEERREKEIQGVLVHEMVHCWQWNAKGTCPGGLIEGIADFVRLKAGLDPPHWKRPTRRKKKDGEKDKEEDQNDLKWDAGYQVTAFFLEWLDDEYGKGNVRNINAMMQENKYEEKTLWKDLFGEDVDSLWKRYAGSWKEEEKA